VINKILWYIVWKLEFKFSEHYSFVTKRVPPPPSII
jgi:hypothetical protein